MRDSRPHPAPLLLLLLLAAGCAARPGYTALSSDGATDFLPFRNGGGALIGPRGATVVTPTRQGAAPGSAIRRAEKADFGGLPGPGGATALLGF